MDKSMLLDKIQDYAQELVIAAIEARKDPWSPSSGHCITKCEEAKKKAKQLLAETKQELIK